MSLSVALTGVVLGDWLLGEPARFHPLAGFGWLADRVEFVLNRPSAPRVVRAAGLAGVTVLLLPPVALVGLAALFLPPTSGWILAAITGGVCLGHRSLREHCLAVAAPLAARDWPRARVAVGRLVSRDTAAMDGDALRRATIESILENGSDGVLATVFWFALGGLAFGPAGAAPAALLHRLSNTLDAMWGYRTDRYRRFGWAAARLDDALNWLPARLAALTYALFGETRTALRCWHRQARGCDSPNAGPVMSAGAGALGLRLGGGSVYHGVWIDKPALGDGRAAEIRDIRRALLLLLQTLIAWCAIVIVADYLWP